MCADLQGEGKWSKSSASPSSNRAIQQQRHANLLYSTAGNWFFPHTPLFPIICFGRAADILLKILRMSAWPRKAHFLAPVPFSCVSSGAVPPIDLFRYFFFLSPLHATISWPASTNRFIHMSERLVSHQRYYKQKAKIKFFSPPPSAKHTQFLIGVALEFLTSISEIIFVICASIIWVAFPVTPAGYTREEATESIHPANGCQIVKYKENRNIRHHMTRAQFNSENVLQAKRDSRRRESVPNTQCR